MRSEKEVYDIVLNFAKTDKRRFFKFSRESGKNLKNLLQKGIESNTKIINRSPQGRPGQLLCPGCAADYAISAASSHKGLTR